MFKSVRTRIIAAFVCVSAVVLVAVAIGSYHFLYWGEHAATDFIGQSAAQISSTMFVGIVEDEREIASDPEKYREMRESLRSVCQDCGMSYMYAYHCDVENGTATYIMCVAADDADDERVARERGYGTVVNVDFSSQELRALAGEEVPEALVLDNEFGAMLAWYDKVEAGDGTVLAGADYSINEQRARVWRTAVAIIVLIVLALLALLLVQMRVLHTSVFRPLRAIAGQMKSFSAERASSFEPLGIETNDEMGEIAEAFEGMAGDIEAYLGDIERLTAERVQGQVELDVARHIQLGMVPPLMDKAGAGFEASAVARPARQVGGDFYDCIELGDGRVAVVVGDVSGKGIAAALFMSMAKTVISEGLAAGMSPADALNHANGRLCQENPEGMFTTAFAAVFDTASGHVTYANAGHLPPLVVGDGVRQVEADPGVMLGLFDDSDIADGVLDLGEGEMLLLFTDGVTEAVNAEREFLGDVRLTARVGECAPFANARMLADSVVELVDGFSAGCEQFDDLTVLALASVAGGKIGDGNRNEVGSKRMLPVDFRSFAVIRDEILANGGEDADMRKACLACEEAFVNIVSHSGATCVWCSIAQAEGGLQVVLEDDGAPFDPVASAPTPKAFEDLDGGGMGIGLICQMASSVEYRRERGRNVLEMRFD